MSMPTTTTCSVVATVVETPLHDDVQGVFAARDLVHPTCLQAVTTAGPFPAERHEVGAPATEVSLTDIDAGPR